MEGLNNLGDPRKLAKQWLVVSRLVLIALSGLAFSLFDWDRAVPGIAVGTAVVLVGRGRTLVLGRPRPPGVGYQPTPWILAVVVVLCAVVFILTIAVTFRGHGQLSARSEGSSGLMLVTILYVASFIAAAAVLAWKLEPVDVEP